MDRGLPKLLQSCWAGWDQTGYLWVMQVSQGAADNTPQEQI